MKPGQLLPLDGPTPPAVTPAPRHPSANDRPTQLRRRREQSCLALPTSGDPNTSVRVNFGSRSEWISMSPSAPFNSCAGNTAADDEMQIEAPSIWTVTPGLPELLSGATSVYRGGAPRKRREAQATLCLTGLAELESSLLGAAPEPVDLDELRASLLAQPTWPSDGAPPSDDRPARSRVMVRERRKSTRRSPLSSRSRPTSM